MKQHREEAAKAALPCGCAADTQDPHPPSNTHSYCCPMLNYDDVVKAIREQQKAAMQRLLKRLEFRLEHGFWCLNVSGPQSGTIRAEEIDALLDEETPR